MTGKEILWIALEETDWHDPLGWDGNVVPGADDIGVFSNLYNGNCRVDSAITTGAIKFGAYAGTFHGNAQPITCNGFISDSANSVTGTVDLRGCAVVNSGTWNLSGFNSTTFLTDTTTNWTQNGGPEYAPVSVVLFSVNAITSITFNNLVFQNGFINAQSISPNVNIYFRANSVSIDAKIQLINCGFAVRRTGSVGHASVYLGDNAVITRPGAGEAVGRITLIYASLTGNLSALDAGLVSYYDSTITGTGILNSLLFSSFCSWDSSV